MADYWGAWVKHKEIMNQNWNFPNQKHPLCEGFEYCLEQNNVNNNNKLTPAT